MDLAERTLALLVPYVSDMSSDQVKAGFWNLLIIVRFSRVRTWSERSQSQLQSVFYHTQILKGTLCNVLSNLLPQINVFIHQ